MMRRLRSLGWKKQAFLVCLILIAGSALLANLVQSDFGRIDVKVIRIVDESGLSVTGKLYRPIAATEDTPQPGVLLLHGMNNDKDTEAPAALELARHGIVALALDELSHGDSDPVSNPLGSMMSLSSYTLGANASYRFLKGLPFVDGTQTGLVGHSMGASVVRTLARTNPDHRAVVIQAGGPDNLTTGSYMKNYLNVWAFYEELFTIQPRAVFLQRSLEMIAQNEGMPPGSLGEVDHTYGNFGAGTAHRYALCPCTHPGSTWNAKGVTETCAWMLQALVGVSESEAMATSAIGTQTYVIREGAMLFALIVSVLSLVPLGYILLELSWFRIVARPLPRKIPTTRSSWWVYASVNSLIGGLTFLIIPMLGFIAGVMFGAFVPIFLLSTANGSTLWLLTNALVAWLVFRRWFKKARSKHGITHEDVGRLDNIRKDPENRRVVLRTALLACVLFGYLYAIVTLSQSFLGIELRYMWPVFKDFTPLRFVQFLLYLIPVLPFFLVNAGVFLFGMLRQKDLGSPLKTQMIWWLKNVFAMESTLLVVILIEYLPMVILGTGPVLALGGLFGLYGIFLMQILPFFAGMFFLMTAFYLKTGRIYLGTISATILTVWVMAASSMLI